MALFFLIPIRLNLLLEHTQNYYRPSVCSNLSAEVYFLLFSSSYSLLVVFYTPDTRQFTRNFLPADNWIGRGEPIRVSNAPPECPGRSSQRHLEAYIAILRHIAIRKNIATRRHISILTRHSEAHHPLFAGRFYILQQLYRFSDEQRIWLRCHHLRRMPVVIVWNGELPTAGQTHRALLIGSLCARQDSAKIGDCLRLI